MSIKVANLWWLRHVVGFLQVDDGPEDASNDADVMDFLSRILSPVEKILSARTKASVDDALRFYINRRPGALSAVLNDAYELPFVPANATVFFRLVWKCLFGPKPCEVAEDETWVETDDQSTAHLLFDAAADLSEWQRQFVDPASGSSKR